MPKETESNDESEIRAKQEEWMNAWSQATAFGQDRSGTFFLTDRVRAR